MNQRPHRAPPPDRYDEDGVFIEEREPIVEQQVANPPPAVRPSRNGGSMTTAPAEEFVRHDFPTTGFTNLAKAVASVMYEIKPVEKAGWNDFHKYNYARMQDLSTELTPLMGKHGIVVFQNELDRDMFDDGRVVAVRYEFTVVHESGEIWPERPRYTGMSSCRNTKGGFDDKCFNKCHTAARKYFLIGLFQIPTEDEGADADAPAQHNRPPARRAPSPDGKVAPSLLPIIDQETPDSWADRFTKIIAKATTSAEVDTWYNENYRIFEKLKEKHGAVYDQLIEAMDLRDAALRGDTKAAQDPPREDPISSGPIKPKARTAPAPATPPKTDSADKEWLDSLRNAFSACESTLELSEAQNKHMTSRKGKVSEPIWQEAVAIVRAELDRIQGAQE